LHLGGSLRFFGFSDLYISSLFITHISNAADMVSRDSQFGIEATSFQGRGTFSLSDVIFEGTLQGINNYFRNADPVFILATDFD
jgi:hypothetical protein